MYKIAKDYIIDGFNFIGGCAIPLVNHEFKPVDTLFVKGKNQSKENNDPMGLYVGKDHEKGVILTDDFNLLLRLLQLDCGVLYCEYIPHLADNAKELERPFKIASDCPLDAELQQYRVKLPASPKQGQIDAIFTPKSNLQVINANDVQAKPIQWLWQDWLPLGKLTILAGAGGSGKTNILLNLIAIITNGGKFPDGSQCTEQGGILIFSTEDDIADTLKPRLMANGARLENIGFITGRMDDKGELMPFDASEDLPLIFDYAQGRNIKLLMIDPIVNAVGKDINKANDVRNSLQILVDFAQDFNCAVVGITHFSKGTQGTSPAERVIGSQAFTALSRMTWVAVRPEEDGKPCVLTRAKSNISSLDGGFNYMIEPCTVENIPTTKIVWGEYQKGQARKLLNLTEKSNNDEEEKSSLLDEAKAFLVELLREHQEMKSSEVQQLAKEADITTITLRRAREVVCDRPYKKSDGFWYWRLKQGYILQSSNANLVDYGEPFTFT